MILDKKQKNSDLKSLDAHKSNNQVIHNDRKFKPLIFNLVLRIISLRNKLKNDKSMRSKEIDDLDRSFKNDLVDVINDDGSSEFDIYVKKLYTDQEKHK